MTGFFVGNLFVVWLCAFQVWREADVFAHSVKKHKITVDKVVQKK